jgi:hypothetical protein
MLPLTIITPCSRPENLPVVLRSINFDVVNRWIIVHDTQRRPFVKVFPDDEKIEEYSCEGPPNRSGNGPRNMGLNLVTDGFVYFLDDDNIVHPSFYTEIVPKLMPRSIVSFDMEYVNGAVLRGSNPRPRNIDTSMVVFDRVTCGSLKWDLQEYIADGIFIQKLIENSRDQWTYLPIVAAWYNRLRM